MGARAFDNDLFLFCFRSDCGAITLRELRVPLSEGACHDVDAMPRL